MTPRADHRLDIGIGVVVVVVVVVVVYVVTLYMEITYAGP
jgi:hypothetical protein